MVSTARLAAVLLLIVSLTDGAGADGTLAAVATAVPATSAASASTPDHYENDWSYRVRPWERKPVTHVVVEAAGLGDDKRDAASEPQPCAGFRPDEQEVKAFFAHARPVSQRGFLHETDWSACHATGRLNFGDGRSAQWMVQRLGAGYLVIDGQRHYFDCPDCRWNHGGRGR